MEHKITIQDIANMVNVSKSSVSRYLNHGYVSQENAEKIKKAIDETGFQSNFFARRLKMKQSQLIGVILPRIDSVSGAKLLTGINRRLDEYNYQGLILLSEMSIEKELDNIQRFYQQGVDGIIVSALAITERHLTIAESLNIPVVFAGQKHERANYVKIDDYSAGKLMGEYISQQGHKRIVFAGVTELDRAVGIERKQGFIEAVKKADTGCRVDFVETDYTFEMAYQKGSAIMACQPTAIVGATDNISMGILQYLHEQSISIPDDVSLAGFGGYDIGKIAYPSLTSIDFDYEQVGEIAAQGVIDLIQHRKIMLNHDITMQMIKRKSVRKIS